MSRDAAVDLCVKALWVAADDDSATGGPDPLRGIYPVVATITADGLRAGRRRRAAPSASPRRSRERPPARQERQP